MTQWWSKHVVLTIYYCKVYELSCCVIDGHICVLYLHCLSCLTFVRVVGTVNQRLELGIWLLPLLQIILIFCMSQHLQTYDAIWSDTGMSILSCPCSAGVSAALSYRKPASAGIVEFDSRCVREIATSAYSLRHVRPSERVCQTGSHWTDLREQWYWGRLWKYVDRVQIFITLNQQNAQYSYWDTYVILAKLSNPTRSSPQEILIWEQLIIK